MSPGVAIAGPAGSDDAVDHQRRVGPAIARLELP
jgi:hypothetical protein